MKREYNHKAERFVEACGLEVEEVNMNIDKLDENLFSDEQTKLSKIIANIEGLDCDERMKSKAHGRPRETRHCRLFLGQEKEIPYTRRDN